MRRVPAFAFPLLASLLVLGACPPTQLPGEGALNASRDSLADAIAAQGDSYYYERGWSSFAGFGSETTVVVVEGVIVRRMYRAWNELGEETGAWVESGAELGTHDEGEPLLTLHEVYDACQSDVIDEAGGNEVTLTTDDNGILQTCSYWPEGCMDDCAVGFSIEVTWGVHPDVTDDPTPATPYTDQLDTSLATLGELQAERGDTYHYTRHFESWVGFGYETSVVVTDGVVIARSYQAWDDSQTTTDSYEEVGADVGTHADGHPALRLEGLYTECANVILPGAAEGDDVTLSMDTDGVLKSCSYWPANCQDDCSEGFSIALTWGAP